MIGLFVTNLMIGDNVTRYDIIHKDGSETSYVWCDKTKQMVIKEETIMGPIVLYSNGNQECERARTLLETLNIQIQEYRLGNHFSERSFRSEFGGEAEYPQVAIGYKHIGGLKDTLHFFKDRGLIK